MAVTIGSPAPYAPASAILGLIKRNRDKGLPAPVNADVLARAGISASLIPRTLQAMHALELIQQDGAHTDTFEGLRRAPEAEYQARLQEWVKAVYADALSFFDPALDDEVRARDAFRSYQPVGQQSRMVSLFMGLCAAAGMMPEKSGSSRKPTPSPIRKPTSPPRMAKSAPKLAGQSQQRSAPGLPPALAGLLESLPSPEEGWMADQRQRFLATFTAVLDFCIPTVKHRPKLVDDEDQGEAA